MSVEKSLKKVTKKFGGRVKMLHLCTRKTETFFSKPSDTSGLLSKTEITV
jgi:hypothetical protein